MKLKRLSVYNNKKKKIIIFRNIIIRKYTNVLYFTRLINISYNLNKINKT